MDPERIELPRAGFHPAALPVTELQVQKGDHEDLRVEKAGIEPATSALQGRRSPNVSYIPKVFHARLSARYGGAISCLLVLESRVTEIKRNAVGLSSTYSRCTASEARSNGSRFGGTCPAA